MIAVTGAAGFIGSNLAHRLARDGAELLLVDRELTAAKAPNLEGLRRADVVRHIEFIDALEAGRLSPEVIFHLGACSRTTETDWAYLTEINIRYTQRLWAWCASSGRPLIFASSAATYGDGSQGFDDRTPPSRLAPLNLYGRSKNDFDAWAFDQVSAGAPCPPRWAGLKFFNVYGPREVHKGRMASVVWHAHRQIMDTGEMRLFRSNDPAIADGEQRRDFVYVEDCIDHMVRLWKHFAPNGLYNSGTGAARTFLDLTHAVFAAMGRPAKIQFIDMPPDLHRQYQNYTQAVMSSWRDAGIETTPTPLESGVAQTIRAIMAGRS
ncbi:MAG: ADP-glyceromanno-heptose 6-epimerase [Phycisphaerae bacterium]|nr:ADP-glyceromanno-heptose 6-epimerase [Phycisphaerae bacterium]